MRILYLAGIDLSLRQGHAAHVRRLCRTFDGRGHTVRLVTLRPRGAVSWLGPSGGRVEIAAGRLPRWGHMRAELGLARALSRERRFFRPDVTLVRQELFSLAPLLAGRGDGRAPVVLESNASIPGVSRAGGAARLRSALAGRLEGRLLRAADRVGAISPRLAEILIEEHGLAPDRVDVIPNGAVLPELSAASGPETRHRYGVAPSEFLLGFAGNLSALQGLDIVLRALAEYGDRSVRLWVVGDGIAGRRLEALARRLDLTGRVAFLGGLPEEEAIRLSLACHLLLAPYRPSTYRSTGIEPLKLLQAMACDRPFLVSDGEGLDLLRELPPGAGERVPADDPAAWAEAIGRWRRRWREAGEPPTDWPWTEGAGPGRAFIRQKRTWEHTAAAWEECFARASSGRLSSGGPGRRSR